MLKKFFHVDGQGRFLAGLIIAFAGGLLPVVGGHAAETGLLHLNCTNPAGSANWSIVVDLDHGLVDTRSATITSSWISWHNANGGVFEFERATGKLQLRAASSTGGYFLHYTCQSE
jgi:hypothetical protein